MTLNESKKIKLSDNFTLFELIDSSTASRLNLRKYQELITNAQISNLQKLVTNVLQPLREYLGEPVIISSGFRSPMLNRAIGGAKNSDHMKGFAADIVTDKLEEAFYFIKNNCMFRQLILEESNGKKWIHVSYNEADNKHEVLTFKDGKYELLKQNIQQAD